GTLARRRRVDGADAGMGMGRTQDGRMGLLRQVDVIEIAAATGEQPQIFLADNRLTHSELHGVPLGTVRNSLHIVERAAGDKSVSRMALRAVRKAAAYRGIVTADSTR